MVSLVTYLPVSAVFEDESCSFQRFCAIVRSLSRTDTLIWCARLNLIVSNPEDVDPVWRQEESMRAIFDGEEIRRINRHVANNGGREKIAVFFRAQLLEMIRWTCLLATDLANDGETFVDANVRREFAKAVLIVGELWCTQTFSEWPANDPSSGPERRIHAMASVRQAISLNAGANSLLTAMGRSISLYGLTFRENYPSAEREFVAARGISIDDYLACVCGFAADLPNAVASDATKRKNGLFNRNDPGEGLSPTASSIVKQYLDFEAITPEQLKADFWGEAIDPPQIYQATSYFTHLPLRRRAILTTRDGRSIVLDSVFFLDKASTGPLFTILDAAKPHPHANAIFGAFGKAFEESVNVSLSLMYGNENSALAKRLLLSPTAATSKGDVELVDACLNDVLDLVLFESKAVFLPEESMTTTAYPQALRKKYSDDGSGKSRKKGVYQLARSIRGLATGGLVPKAFATEAVQRIFPVLLVHDPWLSTPGHAEFFAAEFERALAPDHAFENGSMRLADKTVTALIVMTMSDLETLQSSIDNFRLVDLLADYAGTCRGGQRPSLQDFMSANRHRYRLIYSRDLADQAIDSLSRAARLLFNRDDSEEP